MTDEYIRKQDVVDEINTNADDLEQNGSIPYAQGARAMAIVVEQMSPADVVPVEILKAEIYKLKCQQDSKNQDYYTGYMSALSTVEGILAEMDREEL